MRPLLARLLARPSRRTKWIALVGLVVVAVALVDVSIVGPRVYVRWPEDIATGDRVARERRYGLLNGEPDRQSRSTWQYELADRSSANLAALLADPLAEDTHNIDKATLSVPRSWIRVTRRRLPPLPVPFPFHTGDPLGDPRGLLRAHGTLCLWLAGGILLWTARASQPRRRRNVTIATVLFVGAMAVMFPIDPSFVRMGESGRRTASRAGFEEYFDGRVRFEKHLSQVALLEVYHQLEPNEAAPARAFVFLTRGATIWLVLSAIVIGYLERWSAVVLRYLALALLAPATLLYFGWREMGYLSLNVAAFPLLARGLRDNSPHLEAGSALTGLGAALHGSGLVGLAGACLASLCASGQPLTRLGRTMRVVVWGTAAYLGWVAIYVIVLNLPIDTTTSMATSPWRPIFADEIRLRDRVSVAILSATGARDIAMSAWIVGVPLLGAAGFLWRRNANEVRTVLAYAVPSVLFLVFRWPLWGLGIGIDLVLAGFPALYALAWMCAQDQKRTYVAGALFASAHLAFWRVVLDYQFDNPQIR